MSTRRTVFLGGVHGVGKSTLAQLCQAYNVTHLRASELIKAAVRDVRFDEKKRVRDVGGNQSILLNAFDARTASGGKFLLDGHFTLFSTEGKIERIPIETFSALKPSGLAVLTDRPDAIASRINSRDGTGQDAAKLADMQEQEIEHARTVGEALGVYVSIIASADEAAFRGWLSSSGM